RMIPHTNSFRCSTASARSEENGPGHWPRTLAGDRVQLPIIRNPLECVQASVDEADSGTDDQVFDGSRGEELVCSRKVADTSRNHDAEACDVVSAQLHLSSVEPGSDV